MFISKKDLLKKCKISGSQLYKWKKEGMIPEEWFIKLPGVPGSKIFFPEAKIVKRIKTIKKLKKKYTLNVLSKMLSPELTDRVFTVNDLHIVEEINKDLIPVFAKSLNKSVFTFAEMVLMVALSKLQSPVSDQISEIINSIKDHVSKINSTRYILVVLEIDGKYYAVICAELAGIFADSRFNIVERIHLSELANTVKIKYNRSFNFRYDKEVYDEVYSCF